MVVEIKTGTIVRLQGEITPEGSLEVDLPAGLPAGAVEVTLLLSDQPVNGVVRGSVETSADDVPLTDDEITALMVPKPVPFHQIETGVWADRNLGDSLEWLQRQRQIRWEKRQAQWRR